LKKKENERKEANIAISTTWFPIEKPKGEKKVERK